MSIDLNLDGYVAIITGSSSGIGEETAVLFSKLGASVTITGRDEKKIIAVEERCRKVSSNPKILTLKGDITDESFAKKLIEDTVNEFGKLDILINNAATVKPSSTLCMDTQAISQAMDYFDIQMKTNLRAAIHLTLLASSHLIKTKGVILNVSSNASKIPAKSFSFYCSLKSALDMFTKCAALDLSSKGVRVISINPGGVDTPMVHSLLQKISTIKDLEKSGLCQLPQETAIFIAFLISKHARILNGNNIFISNEAMIYNNMIINKEMENLEYT